MGLSIASHPMSRSRGTMPGFQATLFCISLCVACGTATVQPPVVASRPLSLPVAPPSQPTAEEDELPGLDSEDVAPVVMARYGAVGGCHTIQYSGGPTAAGSLAVDWMIQPDGSVVEAEVVESSFTEDRFHDCVLAVTRRMQFPAAPGTTSVSWKFRFAEGRNLASHTPATFRQ